MDQMPTELLLYIFEMVPGVDLEACNYVCKKWAWLVQNSASIWRGSSEVKAIGHGTYAPFLCRHLQIFPNVKYIDVTDTYTTFHLTKFIRLLGRRKVEKIRLRDPNHLIKYARNILLLPSVMELQIELYKLKQREWRLSSLQQQFQNLPKMHSFMFVSRINVVWKRVSGTSYVRFVDGCHPFTEIVAEDSSTMFSAS